MSRLIGAVALAFALAAPALSGAQAAHPKPPTGFWVAGDLHVHTIYGHDTCIDPVTAWDDTSPDRSARTSCEDAYTISFTPRQRLQEASDRRLDFLAITDHNNVVNQTDPDELSWLRAHPGFVFLPAYENSQPGHVQMLGARACYSNTGVVPGSTVQCNHAVTDQSAAGEEALAAALRADGGVFQINHPSDRSWLSKIGYAIVPDTVEVWNIGPWVYQNPFPASNDNDFSLRWYDGFLDRGFQVGVTGGSDSHWLLTDAVQGVGEPTTWVFVKRLSMAGVLEGLRAHRTFVSALPPVLSGPQLFLEADRNGDGIFEAIAGSETASTAAFRVRAPGALPGSIVRVVTDAGTVELPLPAVGPLTFRLGTGGVPAAAMWVRAELLVPDAKEARRTACNPIVGDQTTVCRNDLLMQALSSPIYLR
jgi:hypothetical protein